MKKPPDVVDAEIYEMPRLTPKQLNPPNPAGGPGQFLAGVSGNPAGDPSLRMQQRQFKIELRKLIDARVMPAIEAVFDDEDVSTSERAAIGLKLLEFAYPKPKQTVSDEDGEGKQTALQALVEALTERE